MTPIQTKRDLGDIAQALRDIANRLDLFLLRQEEGDPVPYQGAFGLSRELGIASRKLTVLTKNLCK